MQAATRLAVVSAISATALGLELGLVTTGSAQQSQAERGKYLVMLGSCTDCHTPGYFFGKPDMARYLGGSEVGFEIPGLGVFHGPNLTPDNETGIGNWTVAQIVTAIQTGKRPDGRELAPIMPWRAFANMTKDDATAIAVFLKSIPPVKNKVPGPFGPNDKATQFVMKVVPGEGKP
jgi:mono/diheme cytochrome c family protein